MRLLIWLCIFFFFPVLVWAKSVVINEIAWMGGENSSDEWIELKNLSDEDIDLDGWALRAKDGSPDIDLEGQIKANSFYLLERSDDESVPGVRADLIYAGALSNGGEYLELFDNEGNLVDFVDGSEAWQAGNNESKQTMVRIGLSWFDSLNPYGSPRAENKSVEEESDEKIEEKSKKSQNTSVESEKQKNQIDFFKNIIITEIFPNPKGDDTETEFIEIYNNGNKDLNLLNCELKDASKRAFKIKEPLNLKAKHYLVFFRKTTKIALNNNGDFIAFYNPQKEIVSKVFYDEARENKSYNFDFETKKYSWQKNISPGKENIIQYPNPAPIVDFSFPKEIFAGVPVDFDASDTVDDNENLKFFWDFGDGVNLELKNPQHTFLQAGTYTVSLSVDDGENKITKIKTIKVLGQGNKNTQNNGKILINEVLPNPIGLDNEGEFVELYNPNNFTINLNSWCLDDVEGGSKEYCFEDEEILPYSFLLLPRKTTKIAYNNNQDEVRLFDNAHNLIDSVSYSGAKEGFSYARFEDTWAWTKELSPGEENEKELDEDELLRENNNDFSIPQREIFYQNKEKYNAINNQNKYLSIRGSVSALPGMISTQTFYIMSDEHGFEVYSYYKDFPRLNLGDFVEINGEINMDKRRIKIKDKNDVIILEHNKFFPVLSLEDMDFASEALNSLISVQGEVLEKQSGKLVINNGFDDFWVYFRKNTKNVLKNIKKGDDVEIVGILKNSKNVFEIIPRFEEDVIFMATSSNQNNEITDFSEKETWRLQTGSKNNFFTKNVLIFFALALMSVSVYFFLK